MKLHLINGETIEIFRQTVAYYYTYKNERTVCERNINPFEMINKEGRGYFAIGPWGCEGYRDEYGHYHYTIEKFEKLIPIKSVLYITELNKWEKTDNSNDFVKENEMDILSYD